MKSASRYEARVRAVLAATGFVLGTEEERLIREQLKSSRRYFFMVAKRREGKRLIERFIKIPQNNSKKLLEPFKRQIEFAKYLSARRIIPTRRVIDANVDPKKGTPYAIMESFPAGSARIGFIWRDQGSEKLGAREARSVFKSIQKLHEAPWASMPKDLQRLLKRSPSTYEEFTKRVRHALNRRVIPLDAHKRRREAFHRVASRRLDRPELWSEVADLLAKWEPLIRERANRRLALIHGDLAPNNFYVFDSGAVEFLDYEWAGYSGNAALAMAFDVGHIRARTWTSASFRKALDQAVLRAYAKRGKKELGRAILSLGTLLFSAQMSGAFENYPYDKQRLPRQKRRRAITEHQILEAWEF
ncbi:MAG TPA: phosphotransferase [Candidatus Paceibacterota bacterium]|nr:phosphotransferase [Candidatus Paceibacterota bacterium]